MGRTQPPSLREPTPTRWPQDPERNKKNDVAELFGSVQGVRWNYCGGVVDCGGFGAKIKNLYRITFFLFFRVSLFLQNPPHPPQRYKNTQKIVQIHCFCLWWIFKQIHHNAPQIHHSCQALFRLQGAYKCGHPRAREVDGVSLAYPAKAHHRGHAIYRLGFPRLTRPGCLLCFAGRLVSGQAPARAPRPRTDRYRSGFGSGAAAGFLLH